MTVFLTGGTGFLGQYLLAELLQRGRRVCALYRNERKRQRTEHFLKNLSIPGGSGLLRWLQGDILQIHSEWEDWCRKTPLLKEADTILHSAASLRFFENDSGEPYKTNVKGAEALYRLVSRTPMKLYLMSTAFVCGLVPEGTVYERIHPQGDFVNDYEKSKWQAERILSDKATILRPGIIVGHSQTGSADSFTGWYKIVKILHMLDQSFGGNANESRYHLGINIPSDPSATVNIVPVDYVAKAAVQLIEDPVNHGNIFHLTHRAPPTMEWNLRVLCERFRLGGLTFSGPQAEVAQPATSLHQMIHQQALPMLTYFSNNPTFDRTHTDMALPNLPVPDITSDLVNRLIDYAVSKNWGQPL